MYGLIDFTVFAQPFQASTYSYLKHFLQKKRLRAGLTDISCQVRGNLRAEVAHGVFASMHWQQQQGLVIAPRPASPTTFDPLAQDNNVHRFEKRMLCSCFESAMPSLSPLRGTNLMSGSTVFFVEKCFTDVTSVIHLESKIPREDMRGWRSLRPLETFHKPNKFHEKIFILLTNAVR